MMKAPAFWYQPDNPLGRLLAPLGIVYRLGALVRRLGARPYQAKVPVICVGNIVAGGSGKTPTALAIAALLKDAGHKPAFVTRGYGGRLQGVLRVDRSVHSARDVGDEALLLARGAPTWVGRDRVAAIRAAEDYASHIILDDGLQNPHLALSFTFLVIDGAVGFGNEHIIPAGPLRETFAHARPRVQAAIIIGEDTHNLAARFTVPVIRATLSPVLPEDFPRHDRFFAFAGIGRPEKFYATCRAAGLNLIGTRDFSDHHIFTFDELKSLWHSASANGTRLLTTEKDFVRLSGDFRSQVLPLPIKLVADEKLAMLVAAL